MRGLCLATLILFATEPLCGAPIEWVRATVSRVEDGDSFIAKTEANVTKMFHLLAVAAPSQDLCQPGWKSSQQKLDKLIAGQAIRLRIQTVGDREYAIVYQQGENVNLKMIESGYAWYQGDHLAGPEFERTRTSLAAAHAEAKRQKLGLWSEGTPAVAPWGYLDFLKAESAKRLQAVGNPWSVAPSTTGALAVVNDMSDFSDKLDQTAILIGQVPPGVLDHAIKISGFDIGLRPNGTLMWWFASAQDRTKSVTYAIPSVASRPLICNRFEKYVPYMDVEVDGKNYFVVGTDDYALFSQDRQWLQTCVQDAGGLDKELTELNAFLASQDIALAIRDDVSSLPFDDLPFSKGNYVASQSLTSIAGFFSNAFPGVTGSKSFAAGTELFPPVGARASILAAVAEGSEAAKWPATMTLSRDRLLDDVPDLSPAIVMALASCRQWNEVLASLWENEGDQPIRLRDFRGITLMLHPYVKIDEDDPLAFFRAWLHVDEAAESFSQLKHFLQARPLDQREPTLPFELKIEDLDGREVLVLSASVPPRLKRPEDLTFCITTSDDQRLFIQGGGMDQLRKTLTNRGDTPLLRDSKSLEPALKLVPDDAQQLLLVDTRQCTRLTTAIIKTLFSNEVTPDFEDGETDSVPLAISGRFAAESITFSAAAPTEALKQMTSSPNTIVTSWPIAYMYWQLVRMNLQDPR